MKRRFINIGRDQVFCLEEFYHELLSEPLYAIVFKDTGKRIMDIGSFNSRDTAEWWLDSSRQRLIDEELERVLLG